MSLAMAAIGPSALSSVQAADPSDVVISDDAALTPSMGPVGNVSDAADQASASNGYISTYTVRAGDTIKSVADMFDVTPATVMWANDLTAGSALKAGMTLTIPPVSGRLITAKDGDTFASLSKKYGVPAGSIAYANDAMQSPEASRGSQRARSAWPPSSTSPRVPRPACRPTMMAIERSTRASSATTRHAEPSDSPAPP